MARPCGGCGSSWAIPRHRCAAAPPPAPVELDAEALRRIAFAGQVWRETTEIPDGLDTTTSCAPAGHELGPGPAALASAVSLEGRAGRPDRLPGGADQRPRHRAGDGRLAHPARPAGRGGAARAGPEAAAASRLFHAPGTESAWPRGSRMRSRRTSWRTCPAWAALTAENMAAVVLPARFRSVTIFTDTDQVGRWYAHALARRLRRKGARSDSAAAGGQGRQRCTGAAQEGRIVLSGGGFLGLRGGPGAPTGRSGAQRPRQARNKSGHDGQAGEPWPEPRPSPKHCAVAAEVDETCLPERSCGSEAPRRGGWASTPSASRRGTGGVLGCDQRRLGRSGSRTARSFWSQQARLWVGIVDRPGSKKTEQLRVGQAAGGTGSRGSCAKRTRRVCRVPGATCGLEETAEEGT